MPANPDGADDAQPGNDHFSTTHHRLCTPDGGSGL
jgi:hypothetical protein